MARALKVFSTPAGFFTAVVAAPSQKAALQAWGVRDNLFATGAAVVVTDPQLVAAALAQPGQIVRVPLAQAPPTASPATHKAAPPAPPPAPPPRPPPDRTALIRAEETLARETRRVTEALEAIEAERAALDVREARVRTEGDEWVRKARAAVDKARETYVAAAVGAKAGAEA